MKLPFAYVNWAHLTAVRADFVKKEMRLTITVRLDDKALNMREVLSTLVVDEKPLLVTLEPIEPTLDDLPLFAAAAEALRPEPGSSIDEVTLSGQSPQGQSGHSVTLKAKD